MVKKEQFAGISYLLYFPKDYQKGKKYPVFFHLHGAGSRGNDFSAFKGSTILNILEKGDSPLSEAICVFPQCHADTWFDLFGSLLDLAKHIYDAPYTDQSRFNGSGVSMGGYGIYQVMMCRPQYFHKAIVCCGAGMYWNAGRMKDIHFRIFHGDEDPAIHVEEAKWMVGRLQEAGADVSLTIYPHCDHNCWDKTYSNYENLRWIIS